MEITIKHKNVYGNDLIYPVCDKAKIFASIANTKTLSIRDLALIKSLGYAVLIEQQVPNGWDQISAQA